MRRVTVRIDTPRGGFVKRGDDGRVGFVSPLPCPFAYGALPGTLAEDGDEIDAIVLGSGHAAGARVEVCVYGEVLFVDAGIPDPKLVCSREPPTRAERLLVRAFFVAYVRLKRAVHRLRGKPGPTEVRGIVWERG